MCDISILVILKKNYYVSVDRDESLEAHKVGQTKDSESIDSI